MVDDQRQKQTERLRKKDWNKNQNVKYQREIKHKDNRERGERSKNYKGMLMK